MKLTFQLVVINDHISIEILIESLFFLKLRSQEFSSPAKFVSPGRTGLYSREEIW